MTMPRDFGFGDEALMLRDAARRFFQTNMPADRLHRLVAANPDPAREPECAWDRGLWQQMAELGWLGLFFPEDVGGLGLSFFDASLVLQKLATTLVPESERVLGTLAAASDALYFDVRDGNVKKLLKLAYADGAQPQEVALPVLGSFGFGGVQATLPGVLLDLESWTRARQIFSSCSYSTMSCGKMPVASSCRTNTRRRLSGGRSP